MMGLPSTVEADSYSYSPSNRTLLSPWPGHNTALPPAVTGGIYWLKARSLACRLPVTRSSARGSEAQHEGHDGLATRTSQPMAPASSAPAYVRSRSPQPTARGVAPPLFTRQYGLLFPLPAAPTQYLPSAQPGPDPICGGRRPPVSGGPDMLTGYVRRSRANLVARSRFWPARTSTTGHAPSPRVRCRSSPPRTPLSV
jgi:hypothetical protein